MSPTKQVTLYLRESVPAAAQIEQQTAVGRLQALHAAGVIDSFVVENWPSRVANGTPETVPALATYERFSRWAREHGTSMRPAFDRHECHSHYTGRRFTATVFPVMCLTVRENETLTSVYPHARRGRPMTVIDGISILESEDNRPRSRRKQSAERRNPPLME